MYVASFALQFLKRKPHMFKKGKLQRKIENNMKEKKETVQTYRDGISIKPAALEINSLKALNMSQSLCRPVF